MSTGSTPRSDGHVDRDEVAEQHERDEPLERASRRARSRASTGAAPAAAISAVSSARSALRGCASRVLEEDGREPAQRARRGPADDLVVVELRAAADANAGSSAFSLIWHFQR